MHNDLNDFWLIKFCTVLRGEVRGLNSFSRTDTSLKLKHCIETFCIEIMMLIASEKRIMAHSNRHGDWPVDAKVLFKE